MTQHGEWLGWASSLVQPLPSSQALSSTWSLNIGTKVKSFTWSLNPGTHVYSGICDISLVPHIAPKPSILQHPKKHPRTNCASAPRQHKAPSVQIQTCLSFCHMPLLHVLDVSSSLALLLLMVQSNSTQQWDVRGILLKNPMAPPSVINSVSATCRA